MICSLLYSENGLVKLTLPLFFFINLLEHLVIFMFWQRRGVVNGIDFGATGEIKKVDVSRMRERLDGGCVVILTNLGYSSSGEVLNCKYAL